MKLSKPKRWRINEDPQSQSDWPIPLSQGHGQVTPIWVWGDRKLAKLVCKALNSIRKSTD